MLTIACDHANVGGGRLHHTFRRGRRVGDVRVAGALAYARTKRGLYVVDVRCGAAS